MSKLNLRTAVAMKNSGGRVKRLNANGASWTDTDHISDFYGVGEGKIAIHLDVEGATVDGGTITKLTNKGGGSSNFDVSNAVAGVTLDGRTISITSPLARLTMANTADIAGVRLLFVVKPANPAGSYRYFGSTGSSIRIAPTVTTLFRQSGNRATTIGPMPDMSYYNLYEIEVSNGSVSMYVNGRLLGESSYPVVDFPLNRLGWGNNTGDEFLGNMGDIIGVTLGAGSEAAIKAARKYLARRFSLAVQIQENPLSSHYGIGPGKIAIHLDTVFAGIDATSGNVTKIVNKGGAGAIFDGVSNPVTGLPVVDKKFVRLGAWADRFTTTNEGDIHNVRMFTVMSFDEVVNNARLFGAQTADSSRFEIVFFVNVDGRKQVRYWKTTGGIPTFVQTGWIHSLPTTGVHILETELTDTTFKVFIDGVEIASTPTGADFIGIPFWIEYVGAGATGTNGIVTNMGDVLGVTLGSSQDAEVIAAVRAYLRRRYSL